MAMERLGSPRMAEPGKSPVNDEATTTPKVSYWRDKLDMEEP